MKKLLKKNQVVITALAVMIAVAGYLNYSSENPVLDTSIEKMKSEGASGNQDDELVSATVNDEMKQSDLTQVDEESKVEETVEDESALENEEEKPKEDSKEKDIASGDAAQDNVDENGEPINPEEVGEVVLTNASVSLSQAKLNREQTRSKAKEMLLEIINNENLTEDAKKEAVNKMIEITETMEKENAVETQLAAKGFQNAIVNISDDSVDVTLSVEELTDVQRTQIEDVVMRKAGCDLQDIVITTIQE